MSMFLPDGQGQAPAPFGAADSTPSEPETTSGDIALMQRVLAAASRNPNLIPADFMAYIVDFIQTSRLQIPIGQVFGYTQQTPQVAARVNTQEDTTSTSYIDLDTKGPQLTGLPDGSYLFLFGALGGVNANGVSAYMSINVNGANPSDGDAAVWTGSLNSIGSEVLSTSVSLVTKDLKNNGSSTVTCQYRTESVSFVASNRWLVAIKYANI